MKNIRSLKISVRKCRGMRWVTVRRTTFLRKNEWKWIRNDEKVQVLVLQDYGSSRRVEGLNIK